MATHCPKCSHRFSPHLTHLPHILPCLHVLCSSCVNPTPHLGQIQCFHPQCLCVVSEDDARALVIDRHLLGSINIYQKAEPLGMTDTSAQFHPLNPQLHTSRSIICFKCSINISQLTCTSCLTSFCSSSCFSLLHRTPAMSSHQASSYQGRLYNGVRNTCKEHGKQLEFVSVEDRRIGCSHCVVFGDLRGRTVVDLTDVVKEIKVSGICRKKIENAKNDLEKLHLNMIDLPQSLSTSYQASMEKLTSHLDMCHRLLETVEGELRNKLRRREEERKGNMFDNRQKLVDKMSKLEQLVEAAEWQTKNPDEVKFNLVQLMEEMDQMNDDVLLTEDVKDEGKIILIIDQTISRFISNHISLSFEDPQEESVSEQTQHTSQLAKALTDLIARLGEDRKGEVGIRPIERLMGVEDVEVVYVESPGSFYVKKTRDWQLAETLRVKLGREWREGERGKVEEGDLVVLKSRDNEFYRVEVNKIEGDKAWIVFIDRGDSDLVPLSCLAGLSDEMSTCLPLAHHCMLDSLDSSSQWSDDAARAVRQFCEDQVCKASVVGRSDTTSQSIMLVNITREEDGASISLLDYLVYTGLVNRQEGDAAGSTSSWTSRSFLSLPLVKTGSEQLVHMAHAVTPSSLFVNLVGEHHSYTEYINSMAEDLHEEYNKEVEDIQRMVLLPMVGLVCVARYSEDGKYYRARVIELLEERLVRLLFVDFGNIEVMHCSVLRRIRDKFLVLPAMAIQVGLAGVEPLEKEWREDSNNFVMETVGNKMRMLVMEETSASSVCKVVLYVRNMKQEVTLNSWMVKEGLATGAEEDVNDFFNSGEQARSTFVSVSLPDIEPGTRISCRVVSASSPAKLCLRKLGEEEQFYSMAADLASHYSASSAPVLLRHWQQGASCVAKTSGEGWARAKVEKEMVDGLVELLLCDYGQVVRVPVETIRPLNGKFCMTAYCWKAHLSGILPAGGVEKMWTWVACDKFGGILQKASMEVVIEVVDEVIKDSLPVIMFVKEKDESSGPLEPEQMIFKSVGDILIDEGLAFPERNGNKATSSCYGDGDMVRIFEEGLDRQKKVAVFTDESLSFQWLPAEVPILSEFAGFVSHVDWDGNLYILALENNLDNLRIIGTVLGSKYSDSTPDPSDLQRSSGQACIALFSLDNKWYRGKVLEVKDTGECLVEFVDYGSVELCQPYNLRKELFMTDLPLQCYTVQMDIRPVGTKWEELVLNFLHKTVVEQVMTVSIIQDRDNFPLFVKLVNKTGLDIAELLINNGFGRRGHLKFEVIENHC